MTVHRIARAAGIALAGCLLAAIPAAGAASRAMAPATLTGLAATTATTTGHPWHDAIAEARVIEAESRLEVAMRVDAAHLEAMISTRTEQPFDLGQASGGSETELRLAGIIRAGMEARFAPAASDPAGATPADDRFDFHWLGRELEGSDCWLYFEWVAPPGDRSAPRPVQVRSTLLIEPHMRQVNTVSLLGHGSAGFDAGRTDWADVELRLAPRTPGPLRVARAGDAGPRILVVSGLGGSGEIERRIAGELREAARVEVAFWPGLDGGAPPPTVLPVGGWARWTGDALRRHLAAQSADPPAIILLVGRATELSAWIPAAGSQRPEIIRVGGPASPAGDEAETAIDVAAVDLFTRSIVSRLRRDLDAIRETTPGPKDGRPAAEAPDDADDADDADAAVARVRRLLRAGSGG